MPFPCGGQAYDEPGATQGRRRDIDRPVVSGDDLLDDRQTETAPAGVPSACLVEPHEPVEDPLPVVRGDPGAVVLDDELDAVTGVTHGDGQGGVGVPGRVVDEVLHHLGQREPVSANPSGPDSGGVDRESGPADAAGRRECQVVEIHVVVRLRERALVGPGQEQQLLHEPLDARGLLEDGVGELALGQGARVRACHLGGLADAGQG